MFQVFLNLKDLWIKPRNKCRYKSRKNIDAMFKCKIRIKNPAGIKRIKYSTLLKDNHISGLYLIDSKIPLNVWII